MTAIQESVQMADIGVRPAAGHIGADITDIDISRPLSAAQVTSVRDALHRYKGIGGDTTWTNLVTAYEGRSDPVKAFVSTLRAEHVNPGFTSHIVDVSVRESTAILDLLYAEITRPEYTVRLRWEPGTMAFWDNRATSHLAPRDLEHLDVRRTLHRVTLVGEVPVGPDGRESELVAGRPFTSEHTVVVAG
ncbi:MAG TPA: TauD/TfdA family dioxygenase [Trebonia sp.]